MLVRVSTVLSAVAVLLANQAVAAPGQDVMPRDEVSARAEMAAMIATDPFFACNCPNNCKHNEGTSCRYYSNYSDSGPVSRGKCGWKNGQLYCYA
ncbi:uncharacterized protein CPUR_03466 [Claviceps purpurea 20.1]|uniref:Uncharacterized protein n=1 Tax=Claviceps purpurea (strain 20.1) TaxID=1111077 RepID=M1WDS2_CLAP2|nr:hypothetical protein E4U12_005563 [Claviceps purpurea]KAG6270557.1 hypothetical protein E4U49_005312 [Claviceps purpurea]KAG6294357.1 hypothetical protein E4U46_006384 [Claviceps purpurea]CCE29619.1 uncharacterized protein CPUR_03466 [Claviceps purpurea 20.1]